MLSSLTKCMGRVDSSELELVYECRLWIPWSGPFISGGNKKRLLISKAKSMYCVYGTMSDMSLVECFTGPETRGLVGTRPHCGNSYVLGVLSLKPSVIGLITCSY